MASHDRFIDKEMQANTTKVNACASCMKICWEQFKNTACQSCSLPGINNTDGGSETTSTHSKDGANDDGVDNNGNYSSKSDDVEGNFTYHSSDRLDKDDEDGDEVLGNGADGTSPRMSAFGNDGQDFNSGQEEDLPDWLHEIETNNTYDASFLLAAPITQVFLCTACMNINNPTTWIPVFLGKTNNTTWEVFDEEFSKIGHKLDWNGDEGLKNLWGRYYRCPNEEFIQRIQAVHMQQDTPNLKVMHRGVLAGFLDCWNV